RDREAKLKLYESRGVYEYWIVDWRLQQIEVYRREQAFLKLKMTLYASDTLESPLLPDFAYPIARLFM
ncbi:MAG: Uma2 family endonuclease, partial [Roseiflexaceae bacterium]